MDPSVEKNYRVRDPLCFKLTQIVDETERILRLVNLSVQRAFGEQRKSEHLAYSDGDRADARLNLLKEVVLQDFVYDRLHTLLGLALGMERDNMRAEMYVLDEDDDEEKKGD